MHKKKKKIILLKKSLWCFNLIEHVFVCLFIYLFHHYLKIVQTLTIFVFREELLRLYNELSRMLLGDFLFLNAPSDQVF